MLKKALFLLFSVHLLITVISGCCYHCCPTDLARIEGALSHSISFEDYTEIMDVDSHEYILVDQPFHWRIFTGGEILAFQFDPLNGVYASEPCSIGGWQNEFLAKTFTLTSNTDFILDQHQIESGTSFRDYLRVVFDRENHDPFSHIIIDIDSSFLAKSEFNPNEVYTFYLSGLTSDSIEITDSVRLKFNYTM